MTRAFIDDGKSFACPSVVLRRATVLLQHERVSVDGIISNTYRSLGVIENQNYEVISPGLICVTADRKLLHSLLCILGRATLK